MMTRLYHYLWFWTVVTTVVAKMFRADDVVDEEEDDDPPKTKEKTAHDDVHQKIEDLLHNRESFDLNKMSRDPRFKGILNKMQTDPSKKKKKPKAPKRKYDVDFCENAEKKYAATEAFDDKDAKDALDEDDDDDIKKSDGDDKKSDDEKSSRKKSKGKKKKPKLYPVPRMDMFKRGDGRGGKHQVNGCGPPGLSIEEPYGLSTCCNRHNLCYGLCNTGFDWCEDELIRCMEKVCNKLGDNAQKYECHGKAQDFSTANYGSGEFFYKRGQEASCQKRCLPKAEAKKVYKEFLIAFYKEHQPINLSEVDDTLGKYKGKEGRLWLNLLRRYGKSKGLVEFSKVKEEL